MTIPALTLRATRRETKAMAKTLSRRGQAKDAPMPTLTRVQHDYLRALMSGADMRPYNRHRFTRTRRVCERMGLVKHNVSPGHGGARWVLTDAGRTAVSGSEDDVKVGALTQRIRGQQNSPDDGSESYVVTCPSLEMAPVTHRPSSTLRAE